MTKAEWDGLALLIDKGFRGEFDAVKSDTYFLLLRGYERDEVAAGLDWLTRHGAPFTPELPELVQAIAKSSRPSLPTWTEVWPALDRATRLHHDEARGLAALGEQAGPFAVAFAMQKGWRELGRMELQHDDYGALNVRRLGEEFDQWLESVTERMGDGLSLVEATRVRQLNRAPKRLGTADYLAVLGVEQPQITTGGTS